MQLPWQKENDLFHEDQIKSLFTVQRTATFIVAAIRTMILYGKRNIVQNPYERQYLKRLLDSSNSNPTAQYQF